MKGANPNTPDRGCKTPLSHCVHNVTALTTLLEAGAKAGHGDHNGYTKLMLLNLQDDDVECAKVLRRFGADINYRSNICALIHVVVQRHRPKTLSWLLEQDVDLEARDYDGMTALLECIGTQHGDTLQLILNKKPDYQALDTYHEGLLHYIARYGSIEDITIFKEKTDLSTLNVDQRSACSLNRFEKSSNGKTAIELAMWRRDHQSDWALDGQMDLDPDPQAYFVAFQSWIESIRATHIAKTVRSAENNAIQRIPMSEESDLGINTLRIPGSYPKEDSACP